MPFDLINTPINQGVTRLEASAGTGKTFTLAGLFLRLLLEHKVPATEILVVTYTKAATAELRDRIRRRLREAQSAFQGKPTEDGLLKMLRSRAEPENALQSLNLALELIDEIAIDTIHAFCQRTLQERAFESGILFDVELVPDQRDLLEELAADYFRKEIYSQKPVLAAAAIWKGITPDVLARMLKQFVIYPNLRLIPEQPSRPLDVIASDIEKRVAELDKGLEPIIAAREAFVNYFTTKPKWATGRHAKADCIKLHLAVLEEARKTDAASSELWEAIEFFSISAIEEDTGSARGEKKPRPQPEPPLFGVCEFLIQRASEYALAHRLLFLRWASAEMRPRKQQAKQQSYDDLIGRLAGALYGSSGEALANAVRKKYRAALIDEFQDTDPQQWKIFDRVFGRSQGHWLFLIGDPKQAIYGFRGADVSTYVQAAASAGDKHDLNINYRSESGLVRAVNTIFAEAGKQTVFLENGINFDEVQSAGKADQDPFTIGPMRPPPFQVWCWESEDGPVGIGKAIKQLPTSVAAEVSDLLSDESCRVKGRRLQPRDIAVLVESHLQAGCVKGALHSLGIPAVELATASVLESEEARELQWILMGILEPGRENLVKSALTTHTLGWTADRLLEESAKEDKWQRCLQRFAGYREVWEGDGFFYMFSCLLRQEAVMENLLRFADGERRITNLLHLAELLEAASKAQHLGTSRLLQWLEARRLSDEAAPEEYQLRLESDEDAVRIVTIHASKGLEYPVVFCPFFQKDADLKPIRGDNGKHPIKQVVLLHEAQTNQMVWDLSVEPAPANQQRAAKEQLAEKMRLLYVALTRAQNRCYLVSAAYKKKMATPLAWLLYPGKETVENPVAALTKNPPERGVWKVRWNEIAVASVDPANGLPTIAVADLPTDQGMRWIQGDANAEELAARACRRLEIRPAWYLSSFSMLSNRIASRQLLPLEAEQPDHDETASRDQSPDGAEPASPPTGIFALPGGARTGDCLHKILEQFDFAATADSPANASLVKEKMAAYGFPDESHVAAVSAMLNQLSSTPLDGDNLNFTLSRIPKEHRLIELEFHFPASGCDGAEMVRIIRSTTPGRISAPGNGPSGTQFHGFLKGFMDLVFQFGNRFYILDWKSNHLGNRIEDYHREAMAEAIAESFYDLQYHLYTLALDKYLRLRLPGYDYDKHFGGVRYLFVRGVSPERPELGIYRARPSQSVMAGLARALSVFEKGES